MNRRSEMLLVLLLAPWIAGAQPPIPARPGPALVDAAHDPSFESEPPQWMSGPLQSQAKPAAEPDDALMRKIREVGAEMDKKNPEAAEDVPPAEPAPSEPERSTARIYLQGFAALLMVVALIFLATYFLKRFGRRAALFPSPDLVQNLGKVYLTPRVSLHFVRTGGRVLVLAVSQNQTTFLTEFDAAAFEAAQQEATPKPAEKSEENREDFFAQLRAGLDQAVGTRRPEPPADEEIAALRKDIERLQTYLQEDVRGGKE